MNLIPDISIIVPVYNVELYVKECIESILKQSLTNIEIIIINDGSTDKSLEIINKITDSRIKVINKENGGLSSARNRGINESIGKYIMFIDSDDFLVNNTCLEEIFYLAENENVDMVECKYDLYDDSGLLEEGGKYLNKFNNKYINIDEYIKKLYKINFIPVCFKVFKREIIIKNNIFFREGFLHEDEDFTPRILMNINKIAIYNKPFYGYRRRIGSITNTNNIKRDKDIIEISKELICYFKQNNNNIYKSLLMERAINIILEKIYSTNIAIDSSLITLLIENSYTMINKINSRALKLNKKIFYYLYMSEIKFSALKNRIGEVLCLENN